MKIGIIERAFELAKSGTCRDMADLQVKLRKEGYSNVASHLDGRSLRKQLASLINAAK